MFKKIKMNKLSIFILFTLFIACQTANTDSKIESKEKPTEKVLVSQKDSMPPSPDLGSVMGKIDYPTDNRFSKIESKYADRADRFMHKEAYQSFIKMYEAAKSDGINLVIRSAARNFNYQKGIWERKYNGKTKVEGKDLSKAISEPVKRARKILEYSSMPGTSRHHWGTDIDLNSFENDFFESGDGLKIYTWLQKHAHEYGFCQPYTPIGDERPNGYFEEKWHWSYLPIANQFLNKAKDSLTNQMIKGFDGDEAAVPVDMVNNYIFGINHSCKH